MPLFRQIRRSADIFLRIRNHNYSQVKVKVNIIAIVSGKFLTYIGEKATCLMTLTQYSLTPELSSALFEKKKNLDDFINTPTKAEERSTRLIQI